MQKIKKNSLTVKKKFHHTKLFFLPTDFVTGIISYLISNKPGYNKKNNRFPY